MQVSADFSVLISGQVITVSVGDLLNGGQSNSPIQYVAGIHQSDERGFYDIYRGE